MLMLVNYLYVMIRSLYMLSFLTIGLLACQKNDPISKYDVLYNVRFEATWSDSTHPGSYPGNAHFSPLVALSHVPNFFMFFSPVWM